MNKATIEKQLQQKRIQLEILNARLEEVKRLGVVGSRVGREIQEVTEEIKQLEAEKAYLEKPIAKIIGKR